VKAHSFAVFRGRAKLTLVTVPIRSDVRFPLLIEHQNQGQNTPYPPSMQDKSASGGENLGGP
jgi:hypothetical protein